MREIIIKFRGFLLEHFKSKQMQTLIYGLISYEMISYIFFGIGTSVVDYVVFSTLNVMGTNSLIANIFSTACAIIFAYITNKLWVFKSKTNTVLEVMKEFFRFAYARMATLIMTEVILYISLLIYGNDKTANQIAKLIGMVFTIILNYVFSKLFIFNNKGKGTHNGNKKNN